MKNKPKTIKVLLKNKRLASFAATHSQKITDYVNMWVAYYTPMCGEQQAKVSAVDNLRRVFISIERYLQNDFAQIADACTFFDSLYEDDAALTIASKRNGEIA